MYKRQINGTLDLISDGIAPGGTLRNLEAIDARVNWSNNISQNDKILLSDAQTSGGLLISVGEKNTQPLLNLLKSKGINDAVVIGQIEESIHSENLISVC